jgi:hypothetical protein
VAALGIGGGRCIDRELHDWVDEAPIVVEAREDLRDWLLSSLMEQFEQRSGLSANPEAIAVAEEYWAPHVDPVVAAEWEELREPVVAWFAERTSCRKAWQLSQGRSTIDPETGEAFRQFWEGSLAEPARAAALREQVGVLSDRWGDTFAHQVRAVLPGPPGADEPW